MGGINPRQTTLVASLLDGWRTCRTSFMLLMPLCISRNVQPYYPQCGTFNWKILLSHPWNALPSPRYVPTNLLCMVGKRRPATNKVVPPVQSVTRAGFTPCTSPDHWGRQGGPVGEDCFVRWNKNSDIWLKKTPSYIFSVCCCSSAAAPDCKVALGVGLGPRATHVQANLFAKLAQRNQLISDMLCLPTIKYSERLLQSKRKKHVLPHIWTVWHAHF